MTFRQYGQQRISESLVPDDADCTLSALLPVVARDVGKPSNPDPDCGLRRAAEAAPSSTPSSARRIAARAPFRTAETDSGSCRRSETGRFPAAHATPGRLAASWSAQTAALRPLPKSKMRCGFAREVSSWGIDELQAYIRSPSSQTRSCSETQARPPCRRMASAPDPSPATLPSARRRSACSLLPSPQSTKSTPALNFGIQV